MFFVVFVRESPTKTTKNIKVYKIKTKVLSYLQDIHYPPHSHP